MSRRNIENLFLFSKMRNVGGIAQTEAQKSSDLFMKCRYLDEITDSRGTIFATGTPISNSMVELYTIQRYLQYGKLVEDGFQNFDAWASTFGETVTAIELTPEGKGYRPKTRFSRFFNLPELMNRVKEVMDIKTADMLDLPVPEAEYHNIAVKPSPMQKEMVASLAERAEKIRNFSATIPYDMEQQKKEMKEFLDDLTTRDQRMMFAVITMVHTADTKEQLDNDTEALLTTVRKNMCQFAVLKFQQMDGLQTVMPFGVRKIDTFRTLTTESLII